MSLQFVKAKLSNPAVARITLVREGVDPSLEFRVRFFYDAPESEGGGRTQISPWHDVPLRNDDGTYNFIVEIPKWSRRKYEIATGEIYNPIKQDVKNGTLREYTWGDMMFNYGALPQVRRALARHSRRRRLCMKAGMP
jgi:inorganic pyrophosphatase